MIRQALRRILRPRRTVPPRDQRWDSTVEEVYELPDVLRGVKPAPPAGKVPDVDGTPVPVAATTGTGDPERGYQPRHLRDEAAEPTPGYQPRHRAVGARDPWMDALLQPTQAYAALVEALTGHTLHEVGPREADIHGRRIPGAPWERADVLVEVP